MSKEEIPKGTESKTIISSINEADAEVVINEQLREKIINKGKELGLSDEEIEKLIKEGVPSSEKTPKNKDKGFDSLFENEEEKKANDEKQKIVVKKVQKDIEKTFDDEQKKKDNIEINIKLKSIGLSEDYFKDNKDWQNFNKAEKLLIIEQASQNTLSHVRELGEKRFAEENTIQRSWNPSKWKLSGLKKTWNNLGKSYWISKAEKEVLSEVREGKVNPDEKSLNTFIKMQAELKLPVIEKDGKAFIEFEKGNENLSKEEKILIDIFNRSANNFSQIPGSWINERGSKSTDKMFSAFSGENKNHQKFEEVKKEYENQKALLIRSKVQQYEALGMSKSEAKGKAMLDMQQMDAKIGMLQQEITNPDAFEELEKIQTESSWGRLVNNENIWRAGYMAAGYTARKTFMGTVGWLTAPITAGVIGGIRGRRKANENINKSFNEGRKEETFLERREAGKKGLFDNKNENQGALSYVFQGEKVNTKEVAAFIDADSQKQRIDNLVNKINNAKDDREKASLMSQLEARLHYIELKQSQGLVNYGKENPTAVNYELFKTMSQAYVVSTNIDNLGIPLTREMNEDLRERDALLASVMARNEAAFGKEIASYKNAEMLRGALVGAGFAALGGLIREWMQGDHAEHVIEIAKGTPIIKPIETIIHHANVEAVADHGQGAISTLRELQHNLKAEYPDLSKAPESVKHILNTDAHKLAQEYGMYKPGNDAESAFLKSGDKFTVDENGNVKFGNDLLEKGNEIKVDHTYEGKMFDSDHSGEVHESFKAPEQFDPTAGKPLHEMIQGGEHINPENGQYFQDYHNQINPENGQPMHPLAENQGPVNPEDANNFKAPEQVDPTTGKPLHEITKGGNTHNQEWKNDISNNPETEITKLLQEASKTNNDNIKHLFPSEKSMEGWQSIKKMDASKVLKMKESEVSELYKPFIAYLHKIHKITDLEPAKATITNPVNENVFNYLDRSINKLALTNSLDKVKL